MRYFKNFLNDLKGEEKYLTLLIVATLVFAYIVPVYLMPRPFDTDAYTHLVYTGHIKSTGSIYDFYQLLQKKNSQNELEYSGYYNYPFGLWLFGSLVSKMTGIEPFDLSYTLPLLILMITVLIYYVYAKTFLEGASKKMLAVLFLLSMPLVSTFLLSYRPSVFVLPPILCALYLSMKPMGGRDVFRNLLVIGVSLFVICLSHTGSYMFIMLYALAYAMIYPALFGRAHKQMFITLVMTLLVYMLTISTFPVILPQYTDKATLVLSVGEFISSKTHIGYIGDLSRLFYDEIFVRANPVNVMIWSAFFYGIVSLITYVRSRITKNGIKEKMKVFPGIPLLGSVTKISHSVVAAPLWLGPIHSLLTVPGFFRLGREGKCAIITIFFVTLIPGALYTGATGALREMYYALVIMPISAVAGFYWLRERIGKIKRERVRKIVNGAAWFVLTASFVVVPVIGNIYYMPDSAGRDYEINSMKWLGSFGDPGEKSIGPGYRQLTTFSKKQVVDADYGTETNILLKDLENVYLENDSESYAADLHSSYGADYVISSKRVIDNFFATMDRALIDKDTVLDKIYSCKDFGIYSFSGEEKSNDSTVASSTEELAYAEKAPVIEDKSSTYYVQTTAYRINIMKDVPQIKYLGDSEKDFLAGGYLEDYLVLSWYSGPFNEKRSGYLLKDLSYTVRRPQPNQIVYSTTLSGKDRNITWASLTVKYTFYEKAFKKEVTVTNDAMSFPADSLLSVSYTDMQLSPLPQITYGLKDNKESKKTVYPSDDEVSIASESFDRVFFSNGDKGIYMIYDETSPPPSEIDYQGSTSINYSVKNVKISTGIQPADSLHITSYITLGDKDTCESDLLPYLQVHLYPYRNGRPPLAILSYIDDPQLIKDEKSFASILEAHNAFSRLENVSYFEALPFGNEAVDEDVVTRLRESGAKIMSFTRTYNDSYMSLEAQRQAMNDTLYYSANYGAVGDGIIPYDLQRNLDTAKAEADAGATYSLIPAPEVVFAGEGLRSPRMGYYHGKETGAVLLPVVIPDTCPLARGENPEGLFNLWNQSITNAIENDDTTLFLWRSAYIGGTPHLEPMVNLTDRAIKEGLIPETPAEIASYYQSLRNVSAVVNAGHDRVVIAVGNKNRQPVKGVSFKVSMPAINGECPYKASNGKLERIAIKGGTCVCYVSTDLKASESKEMSLESAAAKERLVLSIASGGFEGTTVLSVKDGKGNAVDKVAVNVNDQGYLTDASGLVSVELRRGTYNISAGKPGYDSADYSLKVSDRLQYFAGLLLSRNALAMAVFIILATATITLYVRRRRLRAKRTSDK